MPDLTTGSRDRSEIAVYTPDLPDRRVPVSAWATPVGRGPDASMDTCPFLRGLRSSGSDSTRRLRSTRDHV